MGKSNFSLAVREASSLAVDLSLGLVDDHAHDFDSVKQTLRRRFGRKVTGKALARVYA